MQGAAHPIELPHDFAAIAPAVETALAAAGLSAACGAADDLRLALTEALNNIIEHGGGQASAPPVRIEIAVLGDRVIATLQDRGPPLSPGVVARLCGVDAGDPPAPDSLDLGDLPEGGWGLMLIRQSVDRVEVRREQGRNILRLEKRCVARAAAGADER